MENPEKIEIEGLKTIHKLCNFGADHNMEGCTFTEIVERMFDELKQAHLMMLLMQQGAEMSNWISVNDQLPEFQVPVFAGFYRDGEFIWWIFERYDDDEGWCWARYEGNLESNAYADEYEITHWQPLLEEPKADAEV